MIFMFNTGARNEQRLLHESGALDVIEMPDGYVSNLITNKSIWIIFHLTPDPHTQGKKRRTSKQATWSFNLPAWADCSNVGKVVCLLLAVAM